VDLGLDARPPDTGTQIAAHSTRMTDLMQASHTAVLLEKTGIWPVTAAVGLTAWSITSGSAVSRRWRLLPE
jgi:transposase